MANNFDFDFDKSLISKGGKSGQDRLFREEFFIRNGEKVSFQKERKLRKTARDFLFDYIDTFIEQGKKLNDEQKTKFLEFYKKCYINNDFSVTSIYLGSDLERKKQVESILNFCKPKEEKKNK